MKKYLLIISFVLLALLAGCSASQDVDNSEEESFIADLSSHVYQFNVPNLPTGELFFYDDKTGTLSLENSVENFEYTVTDVNLDEATANITIKGTSFSEINGISIKTTITPTGLDLSALGQNISLPISRDN